MTSSLRTLLAFDYGTKRIGVAVGQELTKSATPLITLNNSEKGTDWYDIDHLVKEWRPDAFVVGLPLNADGSEHAVSRAAKQFGDQLQARYNLPVYWVDERLTSVEAESMIAASRKDVKSGRQLRKKAGSRRIAKAQIDSAAARLILESWFNQRPQS
ncbi:MAG: Holliday junction resolvase RuvX [Gammaproteobacteria bacterium]|nr:Holliday junction resolvase RuvX [Gammaproteobacteria bacterium]